MPHGFIGHLRADSRSAGAAAQSMAPELPQSTRRRHPAFPEAAVGACLVSPRFDATKLPLVNQRLRPCPADQEPEETVTGAASLLRKLPDSLRKRIGLSARPEVRPFPTGVDREAVVR